MLRVSHGACLLHAADLHWLLQFGEEAAKEGGPGPGGGGMNDIFDLFSGGGRKQRGPRKGEDVVHRLQVSLKDFYMGCTKYAAHASQSELPPRSCVV